MEVLFRGRRTRPVIFYFFLKTFLDSPPPPSVYLSQQRHHWAERRSWRSGWLPRINARGWVAPVTLQVTLFILFPQAVKGWQLHVICSGSIRWVLVCWCHSARRPGSSAQGVALAWPGRWFSAVCTLSMCLWKAAALLMHLIERDIEIWCLLSLVSELKTYIFYFAATPSKKNKYATVRPVPNSIYGWMCKQKLSCTRSTWNFQHCRQLWHQAPPPPQPDGRLLFFFWSHQIRNLKSSFTFWEPWQ